MTNLVKISLDSDHSVCMTPISYADPISAVPTNQPLLGEKSTSFDRSVSKTDRLVRMYTD